MSLALVVVMEVERVLNLTRGFGWEKQKEEIVGSELRVTLAKTVIDPEAIEGGGD